MFAGACRVCAHRERVAAELAAEQAEEAAFRARTKEAG